MKKKPNIAYFKRELAINKKTNSLREIDMTNSPKAFLKGDEKKPIMLGWEWERVMKKDLETTEEGQTILKKILKGPLQLYINARYECEDLELVSIPATLDQHKKWMDKFLFIKDMDLSKVVGVNTYNRGIHIHISKSAFTQESLKKFIAFVSNKSNKLFINYIAERDITKNRWCRPHNVTFTKDNKGKINASDLSVTTNLVLLDQGCDKSTAVNTTSSFHTIELRIFATTDKKETLYRHLEFADALTRFCAVHTFQELYAKDFMEYVLMKKEKYSNLATDKRLLKLGGIIK